MRRAGRKPLRPSSKTKTICAQKVAAHESKRCRIQEGIRNGHEDHIAERGYNSIPQYNLARKSPPLPQAITLPDAKIHRCQRVG